jgi:hypothetical protein
MLNQLCRLVPPESGFPLAAEVVRGPAQNCAGPTSFRGDRYAVNLSVFALLALAVALAGCGIDKADIKAETPPLQIGTGTSPADSTEFLFDPDGLNLVVGFKRPMEGVEVTHLQLVPKPAVMGQVLNPGSNLRQIILENVVLDTIFPAYRLVIDGPTMIEPQIVSYYSRNQSAFEGSIQGRLKIARGDGRARNALVYALVPPGVEGDFPLHGGEDTLLGRPVVGATNTLVLQTEEGAWYRLSGLQLYRRYLVFAIIDTNEDGLYEPLEDWWGYYRNEIDAAVDVASGIALGSTLDPPLPELRTDINFWLVPPGKLGPLSPE